MTQLASATGAEVMLIGMVLPPNYGRRYTMAFEGVFTDIAVQAELAFLPFILDGVATAESLIQGDGIHPKPEAQPLMLNDIWPELVPLL
jgi:acyl-CoA thioesterase-1